MNLKTIKDFKTFAYHYREFYETISNERYSDDVSSINSQLVPDENIKSLLKNIIAIYDNNIEVFDRIKEEIDQGIKNIGNIWGNIKQQINFRFRCEHIFNCYKR